MLYFQLNRKKLVKELIFIRNEANYFIYIFVLLEKRTILFQIVIPRYIFIIYPN